MESRKAKLGQFMLYLRSCSSTMLLTWWWAAKLLSRGHSGSRQSALPDKTLQSFNFNSFHSLLAESQEHLGVYETGVISTLWFLFFSESEITHPCKTSRVSNVDNVLSTCCQGIIQLGFDGSPCQASRTSWPQGFTRPFFLAVFFRITHDGLSERRTTHSLRSDKQFLDLAFVAF